MSYGSLPHVEILFKRLLLFCVLPSLALVPLQAASFASQYSTWAPKEYGEGEEAKDSSNQPSGYQYDEATGATPSLDATQPTQPCRQHQPDQSVALLSLRPSVGLQLHPSKPRICDLAYVLFLVLCVCSFAFQPLAHSPASTPCDLCICLPVAQSGLCRLPSAALQATTTTPPRATTMTPTPASSATAATSSGTCTTVSLPPTCRSAAGGHRRWASNSLPTLCSRTDMPSCRALSLIMWPWPCCPPCVSQELLCRCASSCSSALP